MPDSSRFRRLCIPIALLLVPVLAYPSSAAPPALGPEEAVSDNVTAAAYREQSDPVTAASSTQHLAVWTDFRTGSTQLRATRVSAAGAPLDGHGFVVAEVGGNPEVASDGTDFLVVYEKAGDIYGAIVAADGSVGTEFDIATGSVNRMDPSVAFDGGSYLVVWADDSGIDENDFNLAARRVDPSGAILGSGQIVVSDAPIPDHSAKVASTGAGGWFIAWYTGSTDSNIYGTAVSAAGVVADEDGLPMVITADLENPVGIASNGTGYLLTWEVLDPDDDSRAVLATRLDAEGSVLDTTSLEIATSAGSDLVFPNDVASNGDDYAVIWIDYVSATPAASAIRATRITNDGIGQAAVQAESGSIGPMTNIGDISEISAVGATYVAVHGWGDLSGRTVSSADTSLGPDAPIATSARAQGAADLAAGNNQYLAVWKDGAGVARAIYAGRLSAGGDPLDGPGIELWPVGERPRVASNGSLYLVVWQQGGTIYGVRITPAGQVLDGTPIEIDTSGVFGSRDVDVASRGEEFLVVWRRHDGVDNHVYANTVAPDGTLGDSDGGLGGTQPFSLFAGGLPQNPVVAASQDRYLVTWLDPNNGTEGQIAAASFDPDAVDPTGAPQVVKDADNYPLFSPAVASDGQSFVSVWGDENTTPDEDSDVWMARFDASGTLVEPAAAAVSAAGTWEEPDSITWDGYRYMVAYFYDDDIGPRTRRGFRVTPAGSVLNAETFPLGFQPFNPPSAAASLVPGTTTFIYDRLATEAEFGVAPRVVTRAGDSRPQAASMSAPTAVFQRQKAFQVAWTRPSETVDVRIRKTGVASGFGAFSNFKTGVTTTGGSFTGTPGSTHCFSARSWNDDGYASSFSAERCTAVPLDERAMAAKGTWAKKNAKGYYLNTYMQSSKKGATLSKRVRAKRLALVATKGPGHGTVKVFLGKTLLKKIPLASATLKKKQVITIKRFTSAKTGTVRVVVVSAGKAVRIEGLGVSAF